MIINNNIQSLAGVYANHSSVNKMSRSQREEAGQDEIQISSQAQSFSDALKKLSSIDDVRHDKVAELSNRIAAGSYQVSDEDLAESILSFRY